MTPSWLDGDWRQPVKAPIQGTPANRSALLLEQIVIQHQVETAPRYQRRDVTGDGVPETFCNVYARDVCRALGVPLPENMRANDLVAWLSGSVVCGTGWEPATAHVAQAMANEGMPALAGWFNRNGGSGHIAVVLPSSSPTLEIAQAGRTNFARGALARGFGDLSPSFFVHP